MCKQCVLLYLLDPPEHYAIGSVLLPSEAHQTNRVREGELFFFLKLLFYFGRAWGRARPNAQSRFQWIGCGWIDPIHVFSGSSLASNPGSTLLSGL